MISKTKPERIQMVIFGGTGDLTRTKLIPGLYKLYKRGALPEHISVLGLARSFSNREEYLESLAASLQEENPEIYNQESWAGFKSYLDYMQLDFTEDVGYQKLRHKLKEQEGSQADQHFIYYLATAPNFFPVIAEKLKEYNLSESQDPGWPRLVIEKPFGYSLESAIKFNSRISEVFPEENIYRIDHYLGKEMIQNILVMRFANMFFEPIWNKHYIDNIQIISTETKGIKTRGKYYDKAGALRDMIQSHLLQMLALITMESPADMSTESIRQEKIKLFKTLARSPSPGDIKENLVIGQYKSGTVNNKSVPGYQDEDNIASNSRTETFAALRLKINNLRWGGVPIYLKTGKRLHKKTAKIFVQFKDDFHPDLSQKRDPASNLLIIKIQPEEGVSLQFNAKEPGSQDKITPVFMDFCQQAPDLQNTPEAYEELLVALFKGEQSLFTHWEGVKKSWLYIDRLRDYLEKYQLKPEKYIPGSSGPVSARKMMVRDGRCWWDEEEFDANS
ncbi:MAG: glucose-6-phosphate dehydrogenase [Bacillota bacterium]